MSYNWDKIDRNLVAELKNGDPDHLENVSVKVHWNYEPSEWGHRFLALQGLDDPYAPQSIFTGRISRSSIAALSQVEDVLKIESQY